MIDYGFKEVLDCSFEAAVEKVTAELKEKGFGILSEIDVQEKFEQKLDVKFKRYTILGACNPVMAFEALSVEEDVGLLLPCNVVVYEKEDQTAVSIVRPLQAMSAVKNEELQEVAAEVESALEDVAAALG